MKKYKFILNGELREVSALHLFDACKRIVKAFPQTGKMTISKLNLKQI